MPALSFTFDPSIIPPPPSNLDIALHWARLGIPVFPCREDGPDQKRPYGLPWRLQSTTDEQRIRQWWLRWPGALPGIDLAKTGLIVIDLDGAGGALDWREISDGQAPGPPAADTPNGGRHVYYQRPSDSYGNGRGDLPPKRSHEGIDVRGHGGYVIAPGAQLPDGRTYELDGDLLAAPPLPDWLKTILKPDRPVRLNGQASDGQASHGQAILSVPDDRLDDRKRLYGQAALDREAERVRDASHGGRNETLNKAAFACGQLVAGGCLTEGEVRSRLVLASEACGLIQSDGIRSVKATIESGLKSGAQEPRWPPESQVDERGRLGAESVRSLIRTKDGTFADSVTGEIVEAPALETERDYPEEALKVDGLVGEIADWIMDTSLFPCRLFATAAALAIVGTAVARQVYTGIPRTGTALYWLIIAPTAGGKERPQEAIRQVLGAANIGHMAKPSCASSAKLGMSLNETPAQIQVIDEVGKVLRRFVARHSSSQEIGLLDDYCTVWGKNTGSFSPEGVTVRSDVLIQRPSLSFFGATTPTAFYEQLRAKQIAGGFLNRFIVLRRFVRVGVNPNVRPEDDVPASIVGAVKALHAFQDGPLQTARDPAVKEPDRPPGLFIVPASHEGAVALEAYQAKAWAMILKADEDPVFEIYARAAEMVKRMSLILACGRHWDDMSTCEIQAEDVRFAAGLVDWALASFTNGLRHNMAETDHQANMKEVTRMIRKAGKMRRTELIRKLDGKLDARSLDSVIKMAIEGGTIEEWKEATGEKGRPATWYLVRDSSA
jgi:hypothetical protein